VHSDSPCRGYQQQTYYLPIENGAKDFSCRSLRFEASSSRNFACSDSKPFRISSGFSVLLPLRRGQLPLHGVRRDRIAVSGRCSTRFSTSRVFASRLCQGDFLSVNLWLVVPSSLSPGCGTQLNRLIRRAQARGSPLAAPGFFQTGRLTILSVMFPALCIFQIQRIKGNFFIRNLAGGRKRRGSLAGVADGC